MTSEVLYLKQLSRQHTRDRSAPPRRLFNNSGRVSYDSEVEDWPKRLILVKLSIDCGDFELLADIAGKAIIKRKCRRLSYSTWYPKSKEGEKQTHMRESHGCKTAAIAACHYCEKPRRSESQTPHWHGVVTPCDSLEKVSFQTSSNHQHEHCCNGVTFLSGYTCSSCPLKLEVRVPVIVPHTSGNEVTQLLDSASPSPSSDMIQYLHNTSLIQVPRLSHSVLLMAQSSLPSHWTIAGFASPTGYVHELSLWYVPWVQDSRPSALSIPPADWSLTSPGPGYIDIPLPCPTQKSLSNSI